MDRDEVIAGLRSLPDELDRRFGGLSDRQLRARPAADVWSTLEICCHLRDAGRIEHERITRMVSEDAPVLEEWDQDALAAQRRYNDDDPHGVRADLVDVWRRLADLIGSLPEDAWERTGRHTTRGVVTLGWRATRQVEHPREHFATMHVST